MSCPPAGTPSGKAMNTPPKTAQRQSMAGGRLRKDADYQRAHKAVRKPRSASLRLVLAPHHAPHQPAFPGAAMPTGPRVGLTAGKVVGKAHERNRIKRRMREALRRHIDLLPTGCDLILHPRRAVLDIEFPKLEAEVVRILQQAKAEAARKPATNPPVQAMASTARRG